MTFPPSVRLRPARQAFLFQHYLSRRAALLRAAAFEGRTLSSDERRDLARELRSIAQDRFGAVSTAHLSARPEGRGAVMEAVR